MTPNVPTLDSQPLFEAGMNYANSHQKLIQKVIADRGSYYFLTLDSPGAHASFAVANITVDLQYSDLYFADPNAIGITCFSCSNAVLENFTMDYITLPFTQVQVTAVNAATRTITYQTLPG